MTAAARKAESWTGAAPRFRPRRTLQGRCRAGRRQQLPRAPAEDPSPADASHPDPVTHCRDRWPQEDFSLQITPSLCSLSAGTVGVTLPGPAGGCWSATVTRIAERLLNQSA